MKTIQLSETGALAEEIRNGETVQIVDGETVVAKVVPADKPMTMEERMEQLIREGVVRPPKGKIPDEFFDTPPVDVGVSVLEQLLKDRRSRDW